MSLSGLLDALRRRPAYRRLVEALRAGGPAPMRLDPLDGAKPYLIAALWRDLARPLLWIVPAPDDARRAYDQLLPYLPPAAAPACLLFPEPDALPYERLASDATTTRDRLRVLAVLAGDDQGRTRKGTSEGRAEGGQAPFAVFSPIPPLVIASGYATAQVTLAPELFRRATHVVHVGERLAVEELLARWVAMGYEAVPAVEVPGTFSRRGGIMDVWSPGSDMPARIELFGNVVESLRLFDPATQRSTAQVESVAIAPARELIAAAVPQASGSDRRWAPDTSGLQPDAREAMQEDLARLAVGAWFPGAEFYAPVFQRATLLDYLPAETVLVVDRPARLRAALGELARRGEEVKAAQVARALLPGDFPSPIASWERLRQAVDDTPRRLELDPFAPLEAEPHERDFGGLGFTAPRTYGGQVSMLSVDLTQERQAGGSLVIASLQAQRLSELLQEAGHDLSLRDDVDLLPSPATLVLVRHGLAEGWSLGPSEGSHDAGLTLLSDAEVFGFVKQPRQVRRRALRRDAFVSDLSMGDYVVHVEHGIARFEGTVRRALDGVEREYLVLAYAEGDTLYVPTDQVDRVGRYVGTGGTPTLSRLGGTEWAATKRKVKEAALEYARELLRIYALREVEER
ncbi:MAG: hypothetical protein HY688_05410, partial [Chloroflexi bacterium]|nr:hypothetical protein [Chloroflexota bacterium]